MNAHLKFLLIGLMFTLLVQIGCNKTTANEANLQTASAVVGEWAFADLRYDESRSPFANLATTLGSRLVKNIRTHYVFNADGTCGTQVWVPTTGTMRPDKTGTWRIFDNGNTIEVTFVGLPVERYTVKATANEVLLYAFEQNQPQTDVAMVLVKPDALPLPNSAADRTRRQSQVRFVANDAENELDRGVEEFGDSLVQGISH